MLAWLFRLIGRLPLPALHALGAGAGRLAYRASARYRHKIDHFMAQAGCDAPALKRAALAEGGKGLAEIPWMWTRPTRVTTARMTVENWEVVERARAAGRGVIFLTPHLGCFEVTAQYYAQHGPITVLYSPPRQAWLKQIVDAARARNNLSAAPANLAGVRQLARALKRGEAVGILPDQVPGPDEGVWAEFFGRPAYTMTLPAKLQRMTGAAVVLAFGQRLAHGAGYRLRLFAHEGGFAADALTQARQINRVMEDLIRLAPEQYMWGYNRYKNPAGVAPAPADLESQRSRERAA